MVELSITIARWCQPVPSDLGGSASHLSTSCLEDTKDLRSGSGLTSRQEHVVRCARAEVEDPFPRADVGRVEVHPGRNAATGHRADQRADGQHYVVIQPVRLLGLAISCRAIHVDRVALGRAVVALAGTVRHVGLHPVEGRQTLGARSAGTTTAGPFCTTGCHQSAASPCQSRIRQCSGS